MKETIPYAVFRFGGEVIQMNKPQFEQAVADGRICKCNKCLCCRALEYKRDNDKDWRKIL